MNKQGVDKCQIQEWYPVFESFSIKTKILELPPYFINYLLDDAGLFLLPVSIDSNDALPNRHHNTIDTEDFQVFEGSDDETEKPLSQPYFPELELEVKESIRVLGGAVFPKLNWSAPKDSAWLSPTRNLRCTNFSEIVLLLRSSDSIIHDLCCAYDVCTGQKSPRPEKFVLALRKWYPSFNPAMEFRCFVREKSLVGISQREITVFFPVLVEMKTALRTSIEKFFLKNVKLIFELENYVFDIYIRKDESIKLIDFNPWATVTLPLLFTWDELENDQWRARDGLDFRIVESQYGVRPGLKTSVPYDFLDTSPGSGWDQLFKNANAELGEQISFKK